MPINGFAAFLVANKVLPEAEIAKILAQTDMPFIAYLLQHELLGFAELAQHIAKYFNLSLAKLEAKNIDDFPLDLIDKHLVEQYKILPLIRRDKQLDIAIADPTQIKVLSAIKFHTDLNLKLFVAPFDQLTNIINKLFNKKRYEMAPAEDVPIIKFIDKIIHDAIFKGASDIHFEPYAKTYRIRFRIDGILHEITEPDFALVDRFTARLKIMANLDIAERRLPQDGRFSVTVNKQQTRDCRINICPTLFGEKIVVRILNPQNATLTINELGLEPKQLQVFLEVIKRPQGMILVTGPTGSGKTVSLYAALNELNVPEKNIATVEDPVEINLPGINQVHVNPKIKLDFAVALRAFLRQDPDIIMVGEIRDLETAEIAVKAAQTGHLVLSTLHTNSAAASITRLLNLGVAPFNVNSSLGLIMAQRLVRKLCPHCKSELHIPEATLLDEGFLADELDSLKLYTAGGCDQCNKGYQGRVAVFEVMPISEAMSQIIMQHHQPAAIAAQARREGIVGLRAAALNKVRQGVTSLEEINRII